MRPLLTIGSLLTVVALLASQVSALAAPDLKAQKKWGKSEKDEFVRSLKSDGGLSGVPNKTVSLEDEIKESMIGSHSGEYVGLEYSLSSFVFVGSESANLGIDSIEHRPTLMAGGHLASWIRLAGGLSYQIFRLKTTSGHYEDLRGASGQMVTELALIPLGSPHTRYIILRGGARLNYFWNQSRSDYARPETKDMSGWSMDLLGALGYEWQLGESFFRVHAKMDFIYPVGRKEVSFVQLGPSLGMSYVF